MISDIINSVLTLHSGTNTMESSSIGLIILTEIMYKMLTIYFVSYFISIHFYSQILPKSF